jgi:hypothetical protein
LFSFSPFDHFDIPQKLMADCLSDTIESLQLTPIEWQIEKMIQFFKILRAYPGVILVGGAGGGKTTIHHVLSAMLTNPDYMRHRFAVCP